MVAPEKQQGHAVRALKYASLSFLPFRTRVICLIGIAILVGLGALLIKVSRATSYMGNDPATCVNCHVMRPEYASWRHSSHATVATCNDCHLPHDSKIDALAFKARDGLYHSTVFTFRWEPEVIKLSKGAKPVVQANCVRCHSRTVENVYCPVENARLYHQESQGKETRWCWSCHREVPHGRVHSLSSSPGGMVPELPPVMRRQSPAIKNRVPQ